MEAIHKIFVSIRFDIEEIKVGELVADGKKIFFKYDDDFIKRKLEISPIKLKLQTNINCADHVPFDGLYGVFADSLSDGWGRLLLDKILASKSVNTGAITPLQRLAYVGTEGMGALIYRPENKLESDRDYIINLDKIAKETNIILEGKATDVLDEINLLGGNSGGARPKIIVGYNREKNQIMNAQNDLPNGFEHTLIKFSSSFDKKDIANIEMAYYKMAIDAGIEMSESVLLISKKEDSFFATKRFDRRGNMRLHLHSCSGLMHDNFRLSNMDYGNIMDCAFRLEKKIEAYDKVFRLACFNVFAHNRDDHSKNFSFLMDEFGNWKFSPAYDLTFSSSGHGMHSTMVAGECANPTRKHLLDLANYFSVKKATSIIDEVQSAICNWKKYAEDCGVSKVSKNQIDKVINKKK
jgi:serine/threonine-protein kinase HipA